MLKILPLDLYDPKPVPFPGSEKFDVIIGWILHGFWYAALAGLILGGIKLVVSHRNGNSEEFIEKFGVIFVICIVVSSAGGLIKAFQG